MVENFGNLLPIVQNLPRWYKIFAFSDRQVEVFDDKPAFYLLASGLHSVLMKVAGRGQGQGFIVGEVADVPVLAGLCSSCRCLR